MKLPKAREMSSGNFFIRLRLGGEEICITESSEKECIRQARHVKSEYLAGKRKPQEKREEITLKDACTAFIDELEPVLSPSTIRGYRYVVKSRFQTLMDRNVYDITEAEWVQAINAEARKCAPKTLKNAWGFVSSVLKKRLRLAPPPVVLPQVPPNERPFLSAEQIKVFVGAVKDTEVEIPALLGLSSMRRSEICALRWENVDLKKRLIHIKGAAVFNSDGVFVQKKTNKNNTSARTIPIMMDELYYALEREKKKSGLVCDTHPNVLRDRINSICKRNDLPLVGIHGLRHSFASLAKHLGMPEQVTMQIGGWSDYQTMRKIYTHISQKDAESYKNAMADFYNKGSKTATKKATKSANT